MKLLFNFSDYPDDLDRYANQGALLAQMRGFDGLELTAHLDTLPPLIPEKAVTGVHLGYFPCWLDRYLGNEEAIRREFGSPETAERYYGGKGSEALVRFYRKELDRAERLEAEYVVWHVSDCTVEESFTLRYHHTDGEVINAAAELINAVFTDADENTLLLLENLWQPGLTMLDEEIGLRLLGLIRHKNTGIMLDTGHLLHLEPSLKTEGEAVRFIRRTLDNCPRLCPYIKGIHLNQSLTGEYLKSAWKLAPREDAPWEEKIRVMFPHAFSADRHQPFSTPLVRSLFELVSPKYVVFEFMSGSREEHRKMLETQLSALGL